MTTRRFRAFGLACLALLTVCIFVACRQGDPPAKGKVPLAAANGTGALMNMGQMTFVGTMSGDASIPANLLGPASDGGVSGVGITERARCVVVALPASYTGTGTGTLTGTSNVAIAVQNGVTPAAGDIVLLAEGATNVSSVNDSGPMMVVNPGTGSVPYVITRPFWWSHGSVMPVGSIFSIGGEDTLFGGTFWSTYSTKGQVVDTNDPAMFPDTVGVQVTLVAGVKAITNVPLRSASLSTVVPTLASTGGTVTTTVGYQPFAITPGYLGTASVTVKSVAAGLTTNASDTSVLNVFLSN